MRIVADTNAVVSGLLWRGPPRALIDAALAMRLHLFSSPALIHELEEVLARDKLASRVAASGLTAMELANAYARLAHLVRPASLPEADRLRDPDDAAVLACALEAKVDAIVSGGLDLRTLGAFRGIPILSPTEWALRLGP